METWKDCEQNVVTHSMAHHLVAIAELLDERGYARVSDVARRLSITRGSASITLKGLKRKGLVTYDERRFLGLSAEGAKIALSVRTRREVMNRLFREFLGVSPARAEQDTCMIEHLISGETADRAKGLLEVVESGRPEVRQFLHVLTRHLGQRDAVAELYPPQEAVDYESQ